MTFDENQNVFLVTSVIYSLKNWTNSAESCYDIITVFVQRCMWVGTRFLATIRNLLLVLSLLNCCITSVKNKNKWQEILSRHLKVSWSRFLYTASANQIHITYTLLLGSEILWLLIMKYTFKNALLDKNYWNETKRFILHTISVYNWHTLSDHRILRPTWLWDNLYAAGGWLWR